MIKWYKAVFVRQQAASLLCCSDVCGSELKQFHRTHLENDKSAQRCNSVSQSDASLDAMELTRVRKHSFLHILSNMSSKARPAHEISNTTATGRDRSGMNIISQKTERTEGNYSVNNKLRPWLQLLPRLNSNKTNLRNFSPQTERIFSIELHGRLLLSNPQAGLYKIFPFKVSVNLFHIVWDY